MVKLSQLPVAEERKKKRRNNKNSNGVNPRGYKRLASMGRISVGIINELDSPLDSINRFINLALQTIEEDSQSRQFLIESKQGIRKTSLLLKRLNNYAKRIEKEMEKITERNGQATNTNSK